MKKIIIATIIVCLSLSFTFSQEQSNKQTNRISVVLKPIIEYPPVIVKGEDFKISLISGLNYYDLKWKSGDQFFDTPEDLILNFDKAGEYIPYVFGKALLAYKIDIY